MELLMTTALDAIFERRAVKAFDPIHIPPAVRDHLLDAARVAPSSFNMQPYRFYWVESPAQRNIAAGLCLAQTPAVTASALVVAVADIGSLQSTSQLQLDWMRAQGFPPEKLRDYSRTAKIGRIIFMPGPFGLFGAFKWLLLYAAFLENRRHAATLPPRPLQMGYQKHLARLRKPDDRRRSYGFEHLPNGRL